MPSVVEFFRSQVDSDDTTFVLSHDLTLVRHNAAWTRFAQANDGQALLERFGRGCSIMTAVPTVLQPFYKQGYERALTSQQRWEHDYECSSPDRYRRFRMIVYPIGRVFLGVVNAVLEDVPHDREPSPADESRYLHEGVITLCSNCRRVRNWHGEKRWDWVPDLVANPPGNLSHGICAACVPIYYATEDWAVEPT